MNKKYENLTVYIVGPMEGDDEADSEFIKIENALIASGIPIVQIFNPCKQETKKTGFDVIDSNKQIKKLRMLGKDDEVDNIYRNIWEVDIENVRKADIIIANIPPGTHYVGTTREITIATVLTSFDLIKDNWCGEDREFYETTVRPGLKKLGFRTKPVYLITASKTRINGSMIHGMVRPSGGGVFKCVGQLIDFLKEKYK